ncbi:uncharacterized protein F5891DRAFT_1175738 [Suillus fuscotomentosus]|uniref:Uncharacterized protein n=1 Tax=Suillus fuscotomentosus TaxID=1912939 RepID=A0AAD4DWU4_9AGAM|nr:uncharacterized protein F5891DRAFT_1175738 [Suillus fuscotomentosus]KAG1895325.1 hypothetical protein F5891DRAFT_1175738 [Suillus fuscotomentosus]
MPGNLEDRYIRLEELSHVCINIDLRRHWRQDTLDCQQRTRARPEARYCDGQLYHYFLVMQLHEQVHSRLCNRITGCTLLAMHEISLSAMIRRPTMSSSMQPDCNVHGLRASLACCGRSRTLSRNTSLYENTFKDLEDGVFMNLTKRHRDLSMLHVPRRKCLGKELFSLCTSTSSRSLFTMKILRHRLLCEFFKSFCTSTQPQLSTHCRTASR